MAKKDALMMETLEQLKKVDSFVARLISNKELQKQFFYNPHRAMIEMGFNKPSSNKKIAASNRIFYAGLTNKKLLKFAIEKMPKISLNNDLTKKTKDSLKKGKLETDLRIDILALEAIWKETEFLRELFRISLFDLNKKKLLPKRFTEQEINDHIEIMLIQIRQRVSVKEIGKPFRFGQNEGDGGDSGDSGDSSDSPSDGPQDSPSDGPQDSPSDGPQDSPSDGPQDSPSDGPQDSPSDGPQDSPSDGPQDSPGDSPGDTAGDSGGGDAESEFWVLVPVEVIAIATIAIPVWVFGMVEEEEDIYQVAINAYKGDRESLLQFATLSKIISFTSELISFAQNVERTGYYGKE